VRIAWLALFASTIAFADAKKPVRKPAPATLTSDQLRDFVDAIINDKAGRYEEAISDYKQVDKEEPAIVYNIADIDRRREDYEDAIKGYKKYLDLAPNAPDRAAVQKLIIELEKTPARLVVDGDDLDAVVFIDGKPAGPSPLVTTLAEGEHIVDRIGPTSHSHQRVIAKPLMNQHISGYYSEKTGNVVMSTTTTYGGSWTDRDKQYRMNDRFTLPPGRHDTYFFQPGRACSPVSFEVPPGDAVVYVFIEAPRELDRGKCTPIKVHVQKLQFPKVKK
jgi:tetratricopeptide (TPR) repeat protein